MTICGSESASALASTPTRYVIGDERDRWAVSAGSEGDPWALAQARQTTFYNRKSVEVSTPTIKGASNIETSFLLGTQERWCHRCPHCGEYTNIVFDHVKFNYTSSIINGKEFYDVTVAGFACPHCGCITPEADIRQQPAKWIAENPEAYNSGRRSFWLNAFSSPWTAWKKIILKFLEAKKDPEKLKVVFNTLFGELWEDRGDLADEDEMLQRREVYEAELPDGVLALTCGVDVQDSRLEYEVVGFGMFGETWGIKKGYIMGRPDSPDVWTRLDDVLNHVYKFKNTDKGLRIVVTCVDSGGHFTQEVYEQCRLRFNRNVFPIKGKGGEGIPFVGKPNKVYIKDKKKTVWLYTVGVDAGKSIIMDNLRVQDAGAKYSHFPSNEGLNYDLNFFNGLLSEKLTLSKTKSANRWCWVKLPGHRANEALDCRNYAMAAFRIWDPDMPALKKRLLDNTVKKIKSVSKPKKRRTSNKYLDGGDW